MFQKTDFWIGLAVGAVAGIFGYRFMQEREQQMAARLLAVSFCKCHSVIRQGRNYLESHGKSADPYE